MTNKFRQAALQVLTEVGKPLHVRDITRIALSRGLLQTAGKTPMSSMGAQLITDVNRLGKQSGFVKVGPATFALNPHITLEAQDAVAAIDDTEQELTRRAREINQNVSSKQKGDIAEARIAELVTLFGDQALSCYRPISDDEGIDLIVKQKGSLKTLYIQVKSRWQDKTGSMIVDVKRKTIIDDNSMGLVVCLFDIEEADIWEYLWFVPAPDFLRKGVTRPDGSTVRFISSKNIERMGTWADYLLPKQDLANKLIEQMKRI